jgi:hypothetical protein
VLEMFRRRPVKNHLRPRIKLAKMAAKRKNVKEKSSMLVFTVGNVTIAVME